MYDKMKQAYPSAFYVKVDKAKGIVEVVITGILDVVKKFEEDPSLFKPGLDFHTHQSNFSVVTHRLNPLKIQSFTVSEVTLLISHGESFVLEKGEINSILVTRVLEIW
jgi:hypothetical protein